MSRYAGFVLVTMDARFNASFPQLTPPPPAWGVPMKRIPWVDSDIDFCASRWLVLKLADKIKACKRLALIFVRVGDLVCTDTLDHDPPETVCHEDDWPVRRLEVEPN